MNQNKNVVASLLLTLIMLLSIGQAPIEWDEGRDGGESLDTESDEIDRTGARGVSGEQKVLVIGAKFSDMLDVNFTQDQLNQSFKVQFSDFYENISFGNISINADVFAWLDLPQPRSFYQDPGDNDKSTNLVGKTVCQAEVTALEQWASNNGVTVDFSSYTHLVCLVNGDIYRGIAYSSIFAGTIFSITLADNSLMSVPATVVTESGGFTCEAPNFAGCPSAWEIPPDPVEFWGRVAHEFGHMLGKTHVDSGYVNDYALMAGLYPGHMIAFKSNDADDCGIQLDWLPDANIVNATPGTVEDIVVRPMALDIPGDTQAIRINVSDDDKVFYMVEVRKRINSDGYVHSSGNAIMYDEGVVIYRVDRTKCHDAVTIQDQASIATTDTNGDGVLDDDGHEAWQVGDAPFQNNPANDGGKDISVEVVDTHFNGYVVRVSYEISGLTPADVSITPWNPLEGEYYTPDIWIDSEVNEWNWYANDGEPSGTPNDKSGDIPLVGHVNRLWFRVTNNGQLPALDVEVKAYWSTPPVAGINTVNFDFIGNLTIDEIEPLESVKKYIEWTPIVADLEDDNVFNLHSCIQVKIAELDGGEVTTGDNKAQENIHRFETTSSSPFHPVTMDFMVNNPYDYRTTVYAGVVGLLPGWTYQLAWDMEFVDPLTETPNSVTVTPPVSLNPFTATGVPVEFQVVTWIENRSGGQFADIVVEHLGGNSVSIVPVEKVDVSFDVTFDGSAINVDGNMVSQSFTSAGEDYSDSLVTMEYWTPAGRSILHPIQIGASTSPCHSGFAPGTTIEIVYVSPSGATTTNTRSMNTNGNYMDSFMMQDTGNWTVSYTYTDLDGNSHQWNVLVQIYNGTGQLAPIADGYDRTCGTGTFIDYFSGTEAAPLINGEWNVRVLFAGDSIHQSVVTSNQSVIVEGMPTVDPPVVDPPIVDPPTVDPDVIIDPTHTPTVSWGDDYLGSGTLSYPIATGTNIAVLYTSPSGVEHRDNLSVDSQGAYSNTFSMDESGTWMVDYSYTDSNGVERSWRESVEVEEERRSSGIPSVGFISALSMVALAATLIRRRRLD